MPKQRVQKRTTIGLNVSPQTLTLRHGQILAQHAGTNMQYMKTISTKEDELQKVKHHNVSVGEVDELNGLRRDNHG